MGRKEANDLLEVVDCWPHLPSKERELDRAIVSCFELPVIDSKVSCPDISGVSCPETVLLYPYMEIDLSTKPLPLDHYASHGSTQLFSGNPVSPSIFRSLLLLV